jgi:hypothetical protein
VSEQDKIEIAKELLRLQRAGEISVWIDGGDLIYVGPPITATCTPWLSRMLATRCDWYGAANLLKRPMMLRVIQNRVAEALGVAL